jgi:hypothetical protein
MKVQVNDSFATSITAVGPWTIPQLGVLSVSVFECL